MIFRDGNSKWVRKEITAATEIQQVDTFTPADVQIDNIFTLTAIGAGGPASVSFTATAATAANVAAGLIAAWNASSDALHTPVTASGTTTVILTADTAGVTYNVVGSTDDNTVGNSPTLTRTVTVPGDLGKVRHLFSRRRRAQGLRKSFGSLEPGSSGTAHVAVQHRFGRRGRFWKRAQDTAPWQASAIWNATYNQGYASHLAYSDDIGAVGIPLESVSLPSPHDPVTVFDVDGRTDIADPQEGQDDHLFNPWMFWANRGIQVAIESIFSSRRGSNQRTTTAKKQSRSGRMQRGGNYHNLANTRTTTIDAIPGTNGTVANIDTITLPANSGQGAYTSLPCTFAVILSNGDIGHHGMGTVTATSLTWSGGTFTTNPDTERTIVIAFCARAAEPTQMPARGRERRRGLVKHLPPLCIDPDDADHLSPTEENPGTWEKHNASTNYAEYTKYGVLEETGHALITNEYALYISDDLRIRRRLSPTSKTRSSRSTTPTTKACRQPQRYRRFRAGKATPASGVATDAGSFIEDTEQLWWRGSTAGGARRNGRQREHGHEHFRQHESWQRLLGPRPFRRNDLRVGNRPRRRSRRVRTPADHRVRFDRAKAHGSRRRSTSPPMDSRTNPRTGRRRRRDPESVGRPSAQGDAQ